MSYYDIFKIKKMNILDKEIEEMILNIRNNFIKNDINEKVEKQTLLKEVL